MPQRKVESGLEKGRRSAAGGGGGEPDRRGRREAETCDVFVSWKERRVMLLK